MKIRKIIQRRIRSGARGVNAVGDAHAVISATGQGRTTRVSSRSRRRIVQRSGRTVLSTEMDTGKAAVTRNESAESTGDPPDDEESSEAAERSLPPIDEDVTGQVNAAVPPGDES